MNAISPELLKFSGTRNPAAPYHLGQRYDRQGNFLLEPGNTVVCHLVEESATQAALVDVRARYLAMPEASKLAFTPISSLHMTLFQGIIEYRRTAPYWPADISLDTPIDDMTAILLRRLDGFAGGPAFKVKVIGALPTGLILEGATDQDRQAMRDWRNAFAALFGYRHPDHDSYTFHITFSYVIERFDDAALQGWQSLLDDAVRDICERAPVLELRPPAFCSFLDMNHFEELRVLAAI